jgi:hypothetical protein
MSKKDIERHQKKKRDKLAAAAEKEAKTKRRK